MKTSGFSLIELLVVILIIGIIAAIGISSFVAYTNKLGADAAASDILSAITNAKARVRRTNKDVDVNIATVASGGSFNIIQLQIQEPPSTPPIKKQVGDRAIRVDTLSVSCNPACPLDASGQANITFRAPYGYSENDFKLTFTYRSHARSTYFLGPTAFYKVIK